MIASSDARRTAASTLGRRDDREVRWPLVTFVGLTGARLERPRTSARDATRAVRARNLPRSSRAARPADRSPIPPIRSASCSAASARATCGRWTPTAPSRTRCSCTASSTTRAGIASSTTATTTTRRSRSTSACDLGPLELWLRDSDDDDARDDAATCSGCSAGWRSAGTPRRAACCASTSPTARFWARAIDAPRRRRRRARAPGTPWPEIVAGLDAVLLERFATHERARRGARRASTRASGRGRCGRSRTRRIARALALEHARDGAPRGRGARMARRASASPWRTR